MQQAATQLGYRYRPLPLAVRFSASSRDAAPRPGVPLQDEPANLHDRPRTTCRLCGECLFGCNHGSKTSLDLSTLSDAQRLGAEITTLSEVVEIEPAGEGYVLTVRRWQPQPAAASASWSTSELFARIVVLAAGSLGTTSLLLRNRERLRGLSPR